MKSNAELMSRGIARPKSGKLISSDAKRNIALVTLLPFARILSTFMWNVNRALIVDHADRVLIASNKYNNKAFHTAY